jgi:hypothetical protein
MKGFAPRSPRTFSCSHWPRRRMHRRAPAGGVPQVLNFLGWPIAPRLVQLEDASDARQALARNAILGDCRLPQSSSCMDPASHLVPNRVRFSIGRLFLGLAEERAINALRVGLDVTAEAFEHLAKLQRSSPAVCIRRRRRPCRPPGRNSGLCGRAAVPRSPRSSPVGPRCRWHPWRCRTPYAAPRRAWRPQRWRRTSHPRPPSIGTWCRDPPGRRRARSAARCEQRQPVAVLLNRNVRQERRRGEATPKQFFGRHPRSNLRVPVLVHRDGAVFHSGDDDAARAPRCQASL